MATQPVDAELRKTGIGLVGDVPWGTHFFMFYETKEDLLDTLVPYFKAGLENRELCLWAVAEPLTVEEASDALRQAMPEFDRYLADHSIEILRGRQFYLSGNDPDLERVLRTWGEKTNSALTRGYAGLRVSGSTAWLGRKHWNAFSVYENELNTSISNWRMTALCTYPLAGSTAAEILDVTRTHQFAIARRNKGWEVVETSVLKQAKSEIKRLNDELERRVIERTQQLTDANEEMRKKMIERERAEEALRGSEDRLRLVIDTIPQQIWTGTPDGSVDFFNAQWLSYTGLTQEEAKGDGWQRAIHPDDRERGVRSWREAVAKGTPNEQEVRRRSAEGQYRWFLTRVVPLKDSEGRIVRWYGATTDIDDRKRAEDELRKQKEIFERIFEDIPVMIAFVGEDGRIELVNPEWEHAIGWTLEEIHEQNVDVFAEAYPDPQYRQMVLDAVAASTGEWSDLKVRVRDGRVIDVAAANVHLSHGSILVIAKDVTERKRTEAVLQEAQADLARVTRVVAMGELAAAIAHEVNQPLAAIVTNGNFCLRELAGIGRNLGKLREAIAEIVSDGTRASAIISRIRTLLMKGAPNRAELDINEVIREVLQLLRNELTRNRVSLRTDLAPDLPPVFGDRVQLQQVALNLIMNGIDAMSMITDRPRHLLIKSAKNPDSVLIQVQDSGTGINPEQADRLFEPFFTTKPEGIGMGLSISRSIIESHGGRLWAVAASNGAHFEFTLPAQD